MSAPKRQPARESAADAPMRPTTSPDVIERLDPEPDATRVQHESHAPAVSPLDAAEGDPAPGAWVITTWSGSRYVVVRAPDGVWWFGGKNRPNPRSVALPPQLYRIEPPEPWPPVIGAPLVMDVPRDLRLGDPARAPGGGKVTSNVQRVEPMSLRAALERVGGHDGN